MPLRAKPQIAIGRSTGAYKYSKDIGEVYHTISVEWIRVDILRTAFGQDLLYSFGAFMTVCQIQRNNAEARVLEIMKGNKDPGFSLKKQRDEVFVKRKRASLMLSSWQEIKFLLIYEWGQAIVI